MLLFGSSKENQTKKPKKTRKKQTQKAGERKPRKTLTHLSFDGHLHGILIYIFKNGIRDCIINNIEEPQLELVTYQTAYKL